LRVENKLDEGKRKKNERRKELLSKKLRYNLFQRKVQARKRRELEIEGTNDMEER
jgi:hypothetical protein